MADISLSDENIAFFRKKGVGLQRRGGEYELPRLNPLGALRALVVHS